MENRSLLTDFVIMFSITLIVNAIIIYVWNLIRYGEGIFNWELSFALAIGVTLAIVISNVIRKKKWLAENYDCIILFPGPPNIGP